MAKNFLSPKQVENAKLDFGKKETTLYDGENLMLRLRAGANGVQKVWLLRYTFAGTRKKLSLGKYPLMSLTDARLSAVSALRMLHNPDEPVDPKAAREDATAKQLADSIAAASGEIPRTVAELFERWSNDYLKRNHHDDGEGVRAVFRNHILNEKFAELRLELVRPSHVIALLDGIRDKGLTRTCGIALSSLRQMITFAGLHEWMAYDPTRGLKKDNWEGDGEESDRALSEDEIMQLHKQLISCHIKQVWKHAVWLILATGTRVEETLLAEHRHVNLEARTWLIPAENQKKTNGQPPKDYTVHLSEFAARHMKEIMQLSAHSRYLFPKRARGNDKGLDGPANHKTLTKTLTNCQNVDDKKTAGRKLTKDLVLADGTWTTHDLRRTMSTLMQELDIPSDIINKCQNHRISDKISRTYQRAKLRRAMTEAWNALGELLERLTKRAQEEYENERDGI